MYLGGINTVNMIYFILLRILLLITGILFLQSSKHQYLANQQQSSYNVYQSLQCFQPLNRVLHSIGINKVGIFFYDQSKTGIIRTLLKSIRILNSKRYYSKEIFLLNMQKKKSTIERINIFKQHLLTFFFYIL